MELKKVNRVEVITEKGREIVTRGNFEFQLQDEGQTLKIFKKNKDE